MTYVQIGQLRFSSASQTINGDSNRCNGFQSCFYKCYGSLNAWLMVDSSQVDVVDKEDASEILARRSLSTLKLEGRKDYSQVPLSALKIQSAFAEASGCRCCDLLPDLSDPVEDADRRALQLTANPSQVLFRSIASTCNTSSTQVINFGVAKDGNFTDINVDVLLNEFNIIGRRLENGTSSFDFKPGAGAIAYQMFYKDGEESPEATCSREAFYLNNDGSQLGEIIDLGEATLGTTSGNETDANCDESSCVHECYGDMIISAQTPRQDTVNARRDLEGQTLNFDSLSELFENLYLRPRKQIPGCKCCDIPLESVDGDTMTFETSASSCFITTREVGETSTSQFENLFNSFVRLDVSGNTSITVFDQNLTNATLSTGPITVSIGNRFGSTVDSTCEYPAPKFTLTYGSPSTPDVQTNTPSLANPFTNMSPFTTLLLLFLTIAQILRR